MKKNQKQSINQSEFYKPEFLVEDGHDFAFGGLAPREGP